MNASLLKNPLDKMPNKPQQFGTIIHAKRHGSVGLGLMGSEANEIDLHKTMLRFEYHKSSTAFISISE